MTARLPLIAWLLGLAGLIPFVTLAIGALRPPPSPASQCLVGLISYGAVILAFLGGVHWGFALAPASDTSTRGARLRLGFGVVPSLIGWLALVLQSLISPEAALGVLVAGFVAILVTEQQLVRSDLIPYRYMWLRWGLSVVVVAVLTVTVALRLFGIYVNF